MRWLGLLCAGSVPWAGAAAAACAWPADSLIEVSGSVEQGGLEGSFTRIVAPASGRFKESMQLGFLKTGRGFDGRLAWSQDVSRASHYLNSDFARRLAASEAWLTSHLACPAAGRPTAAVHLRKDAGLDVWRFTPPGGAPIELWYDRRSGRLDRAMLQYSENRLIHHYSDWREVVPGRPYPFVQRDEDPEDESDTVYTVRWLSRIAGAGFGPPPPPHDSRIIGRASTTIPFEDDGRHRVYVAAYIAGKGPFAFELDNGGHFILTEETAKALGLSAEGNFSSTGAGNAVRQSGYVLVDKVRVGGAEMSDQPAKVLALSHNERPGLPPRAGILGLELFERFVVAVDHRRKTVSLQLISDAPRDHPGRRLPLLFDEDAPLVTGSYEGVAGNVMLDIGNAGATIVEDYWAAQHGLTQRLSKGAPRGSAKLSTGTVAIGPFALRGETVAYYGRGERGSEYPRSVAAIAGEPLLSRFNAVYDYGRNAVWLDPLPEAPPHSFEKQR